MTGKESSSHRVDGKDHDVKALWVAVDELNQKFDHLTIEVRQLLAQFTPSPLANLHPAPNHPREIARGHPAVAMDRHRRQPLPLPLNRDNSAEYSHVDCQRPPPHQNLVSKSNSEEGFEELSLDRRTQIIRGRDAPQQNYRDFKTKIDLRTFDGRLHIEDFLDWIRTMENFFDYAVIEENQKVKIVAHKLKAGALAWWEQLQYNRRREGKAPICSWPRMKRLMKARFLPSDYEQILHQQLQQCRQQQRSVADYTKEFYRLGAWVDLQESEQQQVARYIRGLKEAIQDHVALKSIWTLSDAVHLACRAELQLSKTASKQLSTRRNIVEGEGELKKFTPTGITREGSKSSKRLTERAPTPTKPTQIVQRPSILYARPMPRRCLCCHELEHRSNDCPNRKQVTLIDGSYESMADYDEVEADFLDDEYDGAELVQGDEGERVEKLLLTPRRPSSSQQNSIFRSRCTIKQKNCGVIFDSGSTENIVSRALVKALNLTAEKHPRPYKVGWIRQGVDSMANEVRHVPLSIGKSRNEISCDVLDMDECHIILGRSWQFDNGVTYRGRENTYSFMWKDRKIVLLPLVPEFSAQMPSPTKKYMLPTVKATQFNQAATNSRVLFAVVMEECSPKAEKFPEDQREPHPIDENYEGVELAPDSGSTENIVLRALVKALNLPTEKHPQPYKVGWIRRGVASKVDEVCRVLLSIGKSYQDKVSCDVLDMDTCRVILGQPSKFDRRVTHRGRDNTYSFAWKGHIGAVVMEEFCLWTDELHDEIQQLVASYAVVVPTDRPPDKAVVRDENSESSSSQSGGE